MGHNENINVVIDQAPPALQEFKIEKHLEKIHDTIPKNIQGPLSTEKPLEPGKSSFSTETFFKPAKPSLQLLETLESAKSCKNLPIKKKILKHKQTASIVNHSYQIQRLNQKQTENCSTKTNQGELQAEENPC